MTNDMYSIRRRSLLQQIGVNSIAILGARGECKRSASVNYPFRQESDFYYLTGHKETDAVLVLVPGRAEGECIFFTRNADPVRDLWFGKGTEQASICNLYGCDQTFTIDELETIIPTLLANKEKVYFKIGYDAEFDAQIMRWVHVVKAREREGIIAPHIFVNVETLLHAMRIKKDAKEIALIRKAVAITTQAHLRAMQACKPGMFEYELEAELLYEFTRSGARRQAFQTIVGGGTNACTLHYCKNDEVLVDGELVLLDAGAEYQYYAADVSRTFPVNGRFSKEQAAIYQAVLDAELAVIALIKPGVPWCELQQTAERVITERLIALKILTGNVADLCEKKEFKQFFMHRIGHFLGIDVHDAGVYRVGEKWRVLEPGMIFTVEPGIYIAANLSTVDKKWWNIGVRIEDDILVTENGHEVLTAKIPKNIAAIEALMEKK